MFSLILSIYGAVVSSILAYYKVREYRPKAKVDTEFVFLDGYTPGIKVILYNHGSKNINLDKIGLRVNEQHVIESSLNGFEVKPSSNFEYNLNLFEGEFSISQDMLEEGCFHYRPFIIDEVKRTFKGRKKVYNLREVKIEER